MSQILYLGPASGTSIQRIRALGRIGHKVTVVDVAADLPRRANVWLNRFGGFGLDTASAFLLRRQLAGKMFDLALVDSGFFLGPKSLKVIREASPVVGNYNPDNPYLDPPPEGKRWRIFRRTMRDYDLCISIRRPSADENLGRHQLKNYMLVNFAADEICHSPPKQNEELTVPLSEVVFVGTWMPGRGAFIAELLGKGLDISVYGPRWEKAPEFDVIKRVWKGSYLKDLQYRDAIAGAKIALVMLNPDNHDWHTTRSMEIPAIGTVMCAPRTPDHESFYKDGEEVILYDNASECADRCSRLLEDDALRGKIAAAGHQRTFTNRAYNEFLMKDIVQALTSLIS